jgi:hypothetical protein
MDPAEVLAVEVRQYVGEKLKTLVPRVMGQTAIASSRKSASVSGGKWDEPSFFKELESRRGPAEAKAAKSLTQNKMNNFIL